MILFGGAIDWRANKQNMIITSSTEAELLALSQTAKEAIFMGRLFKALLVTAMAGLPLDTRYVHPCDLMG